MDNTKEAIMFLENCIHRGEEDDLQAYEVKYNHWMRKIIKLLEEGEKYKKMWEELENAGRNYSHKYIATTKYLMDNIKQKYFPNTVKKTIKIEIEGGDDVNLWLATIMMKKAFDDIYCSPSMKFKVKEGD